MRFRLFRAGVLRGPLAPPHPQAKCADMVTSARNNPPYLRTQHAPNPRNPPRLHTQHSQSPDNTPHCTLSTAPPAISAHSALVGPRNSRKRSLARQMRGFGDLRPGNPPNPCPAPARVRSCGGLPRNNRPQLHTVRPPEPDYPQSAHSALAKPHNSRKHSLAGQVRSFGDLRPRQPAESVPSAGPSAQLWRPPHETTHHNCTLSIRSHRTTHHYCTPSIRSGRAMTCGDSA